MPIEIFYLLGISVIFCIVGYLFHRMMIWAENRGWVYYRHKGGGSISTGVGNALHQLNTFFEPEMLTKEEMEIEMQQEQDQAGDPPFDLPELDGTSREDKDKD